MNNGHLTDDQIQEILDARMIHCGAVLPLHLGTCSSCRDRLESYRQLYGGLASDPGFVLPPAFADSVLHRTPPSRPALSARWAAWFFLAITACILVLAGLAIYMDLKPLTDQSLRMVNSLATPFRALLAQFQHMLARLNGYAGLFALGGLGLLSAAFFDRLLQRQAFHHRY